MQFAIGLFGIWEKIQFSSSGSLNRGSVPLEYSLMIVSITHRYECDDLSSGPSCFGRSTTFSPWPVDSDLVLKTEYRFRLIAKPVKRKDRMKRKMNV
ncbi:hypothetical protein AAC387_Pa08g2067 [Persea americana]